MSEKEHSISIKIGDVEGFRLPVPESEESFYRSVIASINKNYNKFRFGSNPDSPGVALAKVTLYYAVMTYRSSEQINSERRLLNQFEARIDELLKGID